MIFRSPFPDVAIPDVTLTEYVLRGAAGRAEKPAIVDGPSGRSYSYGQLAGAIRRAAAGLAAHGLRQGEVCAIYSPNLPEYAIAFHAVATLGAVSTTINPLYTVDELRKQLADAQAKYLITVPPLLDKARAAAQATGIRELFVFGEAEGSTPFAALLQQGDTPPAVTIQPSRDLVVLPYSSGTTGLSKGVMLTHRNLVANVAQCEGVLNKDMMCNSDDVMLGLLPFYHIYGMLVIMNLAFSRGATVVTMPRFELEQFLQLIEKYQLTYMHLVPPIVLALAKHPLVDKYNLSSVRTIISGAAPLSAELAQACAARLGCTVGQGYGLTETSPVTHFTTDPAGRPGAVGPVVPNTEALLVDTLTQQPLGPNQDGELWIRGPQVMQGYLHNPAATAITLDAEGWLHTGDIARADDEGHFTIVDRLKELIKYKGYQVAPAELEAVILTNPLVADCAVVGLHDEEAGEIPKAFVVRRPGAGDALDAETLMAYVAERVAPYKKVREVEFIEQIPKTASGKILRRELAARPQMPA